MVYWNLIKGSINRRRISKWTNIKIFNKLYLKKKKEYIGLLCTIYQYNENVLKAVQMPANDSLKSLGQSFLF